MNFVFSGGMDKSRKYFTELVGYMEIRDSYDANKSVIRGASHIRGSKDPVPEAMFHMSVWIFLVTKAKKFFITQRSKNKSKPHMWEPTGGKNNEILEIITLYWMILICGLCVYRKKRWKMQSCLPSMSWRRCRKKEC